MDIGKENETEEAKKFKKTKLTWDDYMDYLIEAINESNFMKRSETKPMATPKDDLESHLTSRATHERNAADIAKRIAKGLGINHQYAYTGMLMHDAGHPFSAHEGEEMFTQIGEIYNVQFFHHNAKGVEVIKSENICEKAISKIPNIQNNPELEKKLKEEFPYFLDIVVSHDGEANADDMNKKEKKYEDMKIAVRSKVTNATAKNQYKCIAQTTEGKIAKFADVIAYLATDIRDGFRLGIYKDFPDEYLELFGEMFANDYVETKQEKIQLARGIIDKIKDEKLRELVQDAKEEENIEIIKTATDITRELSEKGINFETEEEEVKKTIRQHILKYRKERNYAKLPDEEKAFIDSDTQKIIEFTGKKLRVRSAVVAEVTSRMQEFFINDLLKNSKNSGILQFSPTGNKLFFRAKKLNYQTYVPATKWIYQKDVQPKAAHALVDICARSLIETGAIANKFYDRAIRKYVDDKEALRYLSTKYRKPETYQEQKRKYNIRDVKTSQKRYTSSSRVSETASKKELFGNVYEFVQNEGESFAIKYMNTFRAIETQIRMKAEKALDPNYKLSTETEPHNFEEFCKAEVDKDIRKIRERFEIEFSESENVTPEQQERVIKDLIDEERGKMEEKMAIQLSIDYLSGMTDRGFNELAVRTGFMKKEDLSDKDRVDPKTAFENNAKIKQLAQDMAIGKNSGDER